MNHHMKKCVITFANKKMFVLGANRLKSCLDKTRFDGEFIAETQYPPECPTQEEASYGFKAFIIEKALMTNDLILYLDSSAVVLKSLNPVFNKIQSDGYFFPQQPHFLGQQCHERVLKDFNVPRARAMKMPTQLGNIIGISKECQLAIKWVAMFKEKALDGYSLHKAGGQYDEINKSPHLGMYGHRQQAVTSLIAHKLGMNIQPSPWVTERPYLNEPYIKEKFVTPDTIIWIDRKYVKRKLQLLF